MENNASLKVDCCTRRNRILDQVILRQGTEIVVTCYKGKFDNLRSVKITNFWGFVFASAFQGILVHGRVFDVFRTYRTLCRFLCLFVYRSVCLTICLADCMIFVFWLSSFFIYLSRSIYLSIYLPIYLSIYLSDCFVYLHALLN